MFKQAREKDSYRKRMEISKAEEEIKTMRDLDEMMTKKTEEMRWYRAKTKRRKKEKKQVAIRRKSYVEER